MPCPDRQVGAPSLTPLYAVEVDRSLEVIDVAIASSAHDRKRHRRADGLPCGLDCVGRIRRNRHVPRPRRSRCLQRGHLVSGEQPRHVRGGVGLSVAATSPARSARLVSVQTLAAVLCRLRHRHRHAPLLARVGAAPDEGRQGRRAVAFAVCHEHRARRARVRCAGQRCLRSRCRARRLLHGALLPLVPDVHVVPSHGRHGPTTPQATRRKRSSDSALDRAEGARGKSWGSRRASDDERAARSALSRRPARPRCRCRRRCPGRPRGHPPRRRQHRAGQRRCR